MNDQEGSIWYPQLPDGYNEPPKETRYFQPYQTTWQGGYPGQQNYPQHPSRPNYPGYPAQPQYPPAPQYPGTPQYPGMHGYYPHYGNHGQHGQRPPASFPPNYGQQPNVPGYPNRPHRPEQPDNPAYGQQQAPSSAPPGHIPEYPDKRLRAVDPGGIAGCLYHYTYIWTSPSNGFWYYPTFVGKKSIAGYRWDARRRRWEYFGIDLQYVDAFRCS